MKPILYVETNFVIGVSKGHDPNGEDLLVQGCDDIQIAIPSVCFMEALSVLVFEERQRKRFHAELDHHQAEFKRNIRSLKAIEHVKHLDQSRVTGNQLLNEFQERVVEVLTTLSLQATIIEIDPVALKDALGWRRTVIEDPTDGLILRCITGHSRSNPSVPKAFVSFNFNDFGQESVGKKLDEAGIKYFKEVRNALGWLRSRIPSQTDV